MEILFLKALNKGASCVVLDARSNIAKDFKHEVFPHIIVKDSLVFLQNISKGYVSNWQKRWRQSGLHHWL